MKHREFGRFARRLGLVAGLLSAFVAHAQNMRVHFIDVRQEAATLIEFPCAAILIDTGGETNAEF